MPKDGQDSLAYSMIPVALGAGALSWLLFMSGCFDFQHERAIANRAAQAVGESVPPSEPIKFTVKQSGCIHIDSATLDLPNMVAYVKNECSGNRYAVEGYLKLYAKDGTTLSSTQIQVNNLDRLSAGERVEVKEAYLPEDGRVVSADLTLSNGRAPYTNIGEK